MIRKFLRSLGIGSAPKGPPAASTFHKPYAQPQVNFLYNLLFCDNIALFRNEGNMKGSGLWPTLLAEKPDLDALKKIAADEAAEGRVRAIAYNRLRAAGRDVPSKKLLGVIVEVPQWGGLDVLAAFVEGGVRYLNQSGKAAVFEGAGHPVEALAKELVVIAQPLVDRIGPWEKDRLPPPRPGNARLTLLVSDGLYLGEGPFTALQGDPLGGPVLAKAGQLLQQSVEHALKSQG